MQEHSPPKPGHHPTAVGLNAPPPPRGHATSPRRDGGPRGGGVDSGRPSSCQRPVATHLSERRTHKAALSLHRVGGGVRSLSHLDPHAVGGVPQGLSNGHGKAGWNGPPLLNALANHIEAHASADIVASQSRVDDDADFVPSPDGYTLFSVGIEAEIGERLPVRVGIDAHNLLDTVYRDYNSLLRYYADQPGRDIRMRVGMDF